MLNFAQTEFIQSLYNNIQTINSFTHINIMTILKFWAAAVQAHLHSIVEETTDDIVAIQLEKA